MDLNEIAQNAWASARADLPAGENKDDAARHIDARAAAYATQHYRRAAPPEDSPCRPRPIHLGAPSRRPYLLLMPNPAPRPELNETDAARRDRLAEEERLLAVTEAEADRVGTIPADEVHAWVRSLSTPNPMPMPRPRHN